MPSNVARTPSNLLRGIVFTPFARTVTPPLSLPLPRWRRGNGRVTVQFGCCYNYAGVFSPQGAWEAAGILPAQRVCALG